MSENADSCKNTSSDCDGKRRNDDFLFDDYFDKERLRRHLFFEDIDFEGLPAADLVAHFERCALFRNQWQDCCLALAYRMDEAELYRNLGCSSIVELFKRRRYKEDTIKKALRLGRVVSKLPLVRHLFENGRLPWTNLALVARHINVKDEEEWIERIKTSTRDELMDYCRRKNLKPQPVTVDGTTRAKRKMLDLPERTCGRIRRLLADTRAARDGEGLSQAELLEEMIDCFRANGLGRNDTSKTKSRNIVRHIVYENRDTGHLTRVTDGAVDVIDRAELAEMSDLGEPEQLRDLLLKACFASLDQIATAVREKHQVPRNVPEDVERYVRAKSGNLCSAPGCDRTIEVFHHDEPYAALAMHDPRNISGWCKKDAIAIHTDCLDQDECGVPAKGDAATRRRVDKAFCAIRAQSVTPTLVQPGPLLFVETSPSEGEEEGSVPEEPVETRDEHDDDDE